MQQRSRREQRLIWLVLHYELWRDLPGLPPPRRYDEGWHRWKNNHQRALVDAMKADGVLSRKTYWMDVNMPSLIREALSML